MSFWSMMNYVAWGLCGLFVVLLGTDFIKVEKERKAGSFSKTTKM
jgi:uncharacterized membrane protein YuzA (DUF378 family)